jgi:hypothetical protein
MQNEKQNQEKNGKFRKVGEEWKLTINYGGKAIKGTACNRGSDVLFVSDDDSSFKLSLPIANKDYFDTPQKDR